MKATTENTTVSYSRLSAGHFQLKAFHNGEERSFNTTDSILVDDACNSDEGDTSYYDSVEEAQQVVIDELFN